MTPSLQPDAALVTGASAGIGEAYAWRLAARGHDLVLVARRQARLDALADALRMRFGIAVDVMAGDLADSAHLGHLEGRLREDAHIGILVNAASQAVTTPLDRTPSATLDVMLRMAVEAPTRLIQAALPRWLGQARGTVVNVMSVLALAPELGGSDAATQGYLLNLTLALQKDVAGQGVRVQAVLRGISRDETARDALDDRDPTPGPQAMDAAELVDAALTGLNEGEAVTIPGLRDSAQWTAFNEARLRLRPLLWQAHAAERYRSDIPEDA